MIQNRGLQGGGVPFYKATVASFQFRTSFINRLWLRPRGFHQPLELARFFDVANEDPIVEGVAGRYASALFELASEQGVVAEVEQDLVKFQGLFDMSEDFQRLVRSPVIAGDDQARALSVLLEKVGVGALAQNFFKLIAKNRRLFAAPDMVRAFRLLAAKARGEVAADVVSAHELSAEQTEDLKAALKASVGKDVTLNSRVDPSLLGGLVVKIGSRMIDTSIKTKLAGLKVSLQGGV